MILCLNENTVIYHLKNPTPYGQTDLMMTPLEFIHKIAALIPRPRVHLIRYSGVLAPNSKLRKDVIKTSGPATAMMELVKEASDKMGINDKKEDPPGKESIEEAVTEEKKEDNLNKSRASYT